MPNFNRDNRSGGRGGDRKFGGGGFRKGGFDRGGFGGGRSEMHKATCSDCGKTCEVPFKPNGKKPVFCNDCFKNNGGGFEKSGGKNYDNDNDFGNSYEKRGRNDRNDRFGEKQMFQAVCDECGKPCEVPFRPSGDKPVYCNQCFGKDSFKDSFKGNKAPSQSIETKEQLNVINVKLDRIMKTLEYLTSKKENSAESKSAPSKETSKKDAEKPSKKEKKQEELNEVFAEAPMEESPKPKRKKAAKKDSK